MDGGDHEQNKNTGREVGLFFFLVTEEDNDFGIEHVEEE